MSALRLTEPNILFCGDRLDQGGNDYPIKAMGIDCVEVHVGSDAIPKVTKAFGRPIEFILRTRHYQGVGRWRLEASSHAYAGRLS